MPLPEDKPIFESISPDTLEADPEWWQIYQTSFPAAEREPPKTILRGVQTGVAIATRATLAGRTVGIASAHLLERVNIIFLVYLAIAPTHRRRHLGARLFQFTRQSAAAALSHQNRTPSGIIWEVDPPSPGASADSLTRQDRIAFFQGLGATLLPHPYVQPPVNGTPVPMRLMFLPASGTSPPDSATVHFIMEAMYLDKYAALNGIPVSLLNLLGANKPPPETNLIS